MTRWFDGQGGTTRPADGERGASGLVAVRPGGA
jgi:hypothetical protein